jgi:hypothetical protein
MIFHDYANMTELGRQVGLTSHQFGKLLVQAGLRTSAKVPSEAAIELGLVKYVPNDRNGAPYAIWHKDLTLDVLRRVGLITTVDQAKPEE